MIKRAIIFSFAIFLIAPLVYTGSARASQTLENMTASVGVNAVFDMAVFPTSISFGTVNPGTTTAQKDLTVWCSSNNNKSWNVTIEAVEFTSGIFTIPNTEFNWWGWVQTGSGTWNPDAHAGTMDDVAFRIYLAHSSEYITQAPVELKLSFNVDVPANQAAGQYTTTLVLTMTE